MELNLIRKIAWSFHASTKVDYDDLFQEAATAYCEAVQRFSEKKKSKFTTFAYIYMRNALIDFTKHCKEFMYFEDISEKYVSETFQSNKIELTDLFKDDCKVLVDRVLEYPHDYLDKPPKMARGQLIRELVEEGYTVNRAWAALREVREIVADL